MKSKFTPALALAAALAALPAAAQDAVPDAAAFQGGEWILVGNLAEGAILSISGAKYLDGRVLTFALKTEFETGEDASTVDVIELDCAAQKFRSISAAGIKRNGEQVSSNEAGAFDAYPPQSIMGQLSVPLCEQVDNAAQAAPAAPAAALAR